MAYVMLTGISPFLGEDKQETFLNISQLNVSYNEEELQQLNQGAVSFIQTLLHKHPQSVHTLCLSLHLFSLKTPNIFIFSHKIRINVKDLKSESSTAFSPLDGAK